MNKSKTAADFILNHNLQNISDLEIAQKLNDLHNTDDFTRLDISNAHRKIQDGYRVKESTSKTTPRRKSTLQHGDYLDFAVYVAKVGDRFSQDEKRKVITLLSDKWVG